MADTIRQCDGLVNIMSYWTFSDVFEEQGVVKQPFYGGFGLLAAGSIPKPAFNAFALLHRLGDARLDAQGDSVLVTRKPNGSLIVALWNISLRKRAGRRRISCCISTTSKVSGSRQSRSSTATTVRRCPPIKRWAARNIPPRRNSRNFARPPRFRLPPAAHSGTARFL